MRARYSVTTSPHPYGAVVAYAPTLSRERRPLDSTSTRLRI